VLTRGLSDEELTVAVLHHFDGYTQDGIAAALDLSRRTVGKILARFEDHIRKRAARLGYPAAVRSVGDG
jgi:DNA-directed RNA polymerase specialized sigma24 family protein